MNEQQAGPDAQSSRPLAGLTVIDLSQVLAGPLCTMILGDLGADVVKVEPPHGDQSRQSLGTRIGDDSAAFLAVNRNKRSVVLDLQTGSGRAALHRLIAGADVVVENFRPGVAQRLGAGYDQLSELNPRLVYGSLTGFGPRGPYAQRAGLDMVVQAMSGLMSVTGEEDGRLWHRLCELVGLPHLVDDPRFLTNADRLQHRQEPAALLEDALAYRTTGEWVDELVAAGVPGGPLHDYAQTLADPHTQATGMIVETEHPAAGTIRMLGSPLHLAHSTFAVRRRPPLLGEHTAEVLAAAGADDAEPEPVPTAER